jgi:hypothetical protein
VALKDLIADDTKITEEMIEKIVVPYIRYNSAAHKIVWRPAGESLANEAKVLVFLVAVLGWQYVVEERQDVATKPADLEDELRIAGGSLRPILKKLKESHLLAVADGHYRVQLANLDSIQAAIAGSTPKVARKGGARKHASNKQDEADSERAEPVGDANKKKRGVSRQLKPFLTEWTREGFFSEPKTLANLLERYHEHGVITKQTSLSGLMLEAVHDGLLARTKKDVGGKQVWAYSARRS